MCRRSAALYSERDWAQRCSVRPGITGLAQALLRSEATRSERLALDLRYAREHSVWLDLRILGWTAGAPVRRGQQLMCGIFGYWDRDRRPLPDEAAGRRWRASSLHRGPDDEGIRHQPRPRRAPSATGGCRSSTWHTATSLSSRTTARWPWCRTARSSTMSSWPPSCAAHGVLLRTASDTEVILRLYEREGIACLSKLNGMFAIAIDDAREDALYLVRDRIGVKPLVCGRRRRAHAVRLRDQGDPAVDCGARRRAAGGRSWKRSTIT